MKSNYIRELFESHLEDEYFFICPDANDRIIDASIVQKCWSKHNLDLLLYSPQNQYYTETIYSLAVDELKRIINKLIKEYPDIADQISLYFENNDDRDDAIFTIINRDVSNPLLNCINQSNFRGRVMVMTNEDSYASLSHRGYSFEYDGYLKDVIDILCLNPMKVKNELIGRDFKVIGEWSDNSSKNLIEAADYKQFVDELENQTDYMLFTFTGIFPLKQCYDYNFNEFMSIIIPKDNYCGFFNSWNGCGSLMGVQLTRDLKINLRYKRNSTQYDRLSLVVDEPNCFQYCTSEVYGTDKEVQGKEFILKHYNGK